MFTLCYVIETKSKNRLSKSLRLISKSQAEVYKIYGKDNVYVIATYKDRKRAFDKYRVMLSTYKSRINQTIGSGDVSKSKQKSRT